MRQKLRKGVCHLYNINATWLNKVKQIDVVPVHAMKPQSGSRGIALRFLTLVSRRRWVVNFKNRLLYPRKGTPLPIEEEAERAPEPVWTVLEKRKSMSPPPDSNADRPAYGESPYRLRYRIMRDHLEAIKTRALRKAMLGALIDLG
jgi:hypothetical protein